MEWGVCSGLLKKPFCYNFGTAVPDMIQPCRDAMQLFGAFYCVILGSETVELDETP